MFVRELVEYLKLKMPAGRIVSGHFLGKCASVNLPPDELVPRFINACVKANATCGSEKTREGVGILINEQEVKSIMTTKKRRR